jgi:hypothetical protein
MVMRQLPSVIRAEYRGGFRIRLTFNDNSEGTVDFRTWLDGPVFEPLKATDYFQRFFIDGGTVAWPNGADIAPETLYEGVVRGKRNGNGVRVTTRQKEGKRARARVAISRSNN